jgi:hypothetical protein
MTHIDEVIWCKGCGVEITWGAVVRGEEKYCCLDCADGLECDCGVRMELEDERRTEGGSPTDLTGSET